MLVAPLVLLVAIAVVQVALVLHVRATLTTAAAEGARAAALAGADPAAGERRARAVAAEVLSTDAVRDIRVRRETQDGLPLMVVTLTARPGLVTLLGPIDVTVDARALVEGWQ